MTTRTNIDEARARLALLLHHAIEAETIIADALDGFDLDTIGAAMEPILAHFRLLARNEERTSAIDLPIDPAPPPATSHDELDG